MRLRHHLNNALLIDCFCFLFYVVLRSFYNGSGRGREGRAVEQRKEVDAFFFLFLFLSRFFVSLASAPKKTRERHKAQKKKKSTRLLRQLPSLEGPRVHKAGFHGPPSKPPAVQSRSGSGGGARVRENHKHQAHSCNTTAAPRDRHALDAAKLAALLAHVLADVCVLLVVGELPFGDRVVEDEDPRRGRARRRPRRRGREPPGRQGRPCWWSAAATRARAEPSSNGRRKGWARSSWRPTWRSRVRGVSRTRSGRRPGGGGAGGARRTSRCEMERTKKKKRGGRQGLGRPLGTLRQKTRPCCSRRATSPVLRTHTASSRTPAYRKRAPTTPAPRPSTREATMLALTRVPGGSRPAATMR